MQSLQTAGFFENKEINIRDCKIKPIELTTYLLKDAWKLNPEDEEFTVMRVIIKGKDNGKSVTYTYDLFDKYDKTTGFSSMSRTTGFTCAAMTNLILENKFNQKGVFPPELIAGNEEIFNYVMNYLRERKVKYNMIKSDV
ncbi:MAG: hypothetical protein D6799_07770 [Bacteroidetes bacterium]|nr:MAG: hypothetical protein D6799_07770 [Bacteroidota bacterium]